MMKNCLPADVRGEIKETISLSTSWLSARGIADAMFVELTSENIRAIEHECRELVNSGELRSLVASNDSTEFFG